jgi:hypothetical protein
MARMKLTARWDLDEAIKEVKLLGELEEESSQKITELEALCKKLREDTQRLEEEKVTLEEMVKSRDELLIEIAREIGLDHMSEDEGEEEEEEDPDDGGDQWRRSCGGDPWARSPDAAWGRPSRCWARDAIAPSLPCTHEGLWGAPTQDGGWLWWSGWWPEWRLL